MPELRFTSAALEDIAAIAAYIAEASGSRVVAERFAKQLLDCCARLAARPTIMGRARPELQRDIRSIPFRRYVIFFRYAGDMIEVIGILEGHRDVDAHFDDGE